MITITIMITILTLQNSSEILTIKWMESEFYRTNMTMVRLRKLKQL